MQIGKRLYSLALCAGAASAQQPASRPTTVGTPALQRVGSDSLRLTRAEALRTALANNPQLEVARQIVGGARARRVQAIAIPDPAVTASLDDQSRLLGPAGAKNVGVELNIPFPDKFRLRSAVARADIQSADYQYQLLRQQIAAQTARGYDDLLLARRHRRDLSEGRGLAAEFLQKAEARFNAGTVARLDVIRARVDVAQADNTLIANEREIANAEAALNRLLGRPLGAAIVLSDSLDVPRPLPELATVEPIALRVRPELSDLSAQRRGATAATALAREYWLPDLFVAANRDYVAGGGTVFSTGVALPFPLFFWQHSRGEIAESRSRERELAASYRDLQAEISQDLRAAYAFAETSLRQAIYIRDELLPSAREAFRVASVSYGLGGSSALEVLDARRSLLDAQAQYADALAAASSARSDLERAVGAPLDTIGTGGARE